MAPDLEDLNEEKEQQIVELESVIENLKSALDAMKEKKENWSLQNNEKINYA